MYKISDLEIIKEKIISDMIPYTIKNAQCRLFNLCDDTECISKINELLKDFKTICTLEKKYLKKDTNKNKEGS